MDKLLDKEVHKLFKAPSLATYLAASSAAARNANNAPQMAAPPISQAVDVAAGGAVAASNRKSPSSGCESDDSASVRDDTPHSSSKYNGPC